MKTNTILSIMALLGSLLSASAAEQSGGSYEAGLNGRCREKVGDTVDLSIPSWKNTIGAAELGGVWTDPDFDPELKAFYYARVLEIPTPRWTAYDRVKFKLDLPKEVPLKQQERAYTSPIWYNP